MAPKEPGPSTWITRFKHHKTTVLLHIDPLQSIRSIKEELLNALRQTCPAGTTEGTPLPESFDDIQFARPIDIYNASAGWRRLNVNEGAGKQARGTPVQGKGKERVEMGSGYAVDAECLQSLGFRERHLVLAFRFASEVERAAGKKRKAISPDLRDEDGTELAMEEYEDENAEKWDVVIPTWDDNYGVENKGDVGANQDFKG